MICRPTQRNPKDAPPTLPNLVDGFTLLLMLDDQTRELPIALHHGAADRLTYLAPRRLDFLSDIGNQDIKR